MEGELPILLLFYRYRNLTTESSRDNNITLGDVHNLSAGPSWGEKKIKIKRSPVHHVGVEMRKESGNKKNAEEAVIFPAPKIE